MSTDDPGERLKGDVEGRALAEASINRCNGERMEIVAMLAFQQSLIATASCQAVLDLIRHKNLISAAELDGALAHAYATARARLEQKGMVIQRSPTVGAH